ncbi:NAD(P)H-dependent oxidoreductase [Chryseobacterium carnipullorum]|uniref:NAD(P)H-dependent oxidoreductase n=1 Tax=Chryseobacterium carnipullorum TaxID=1124835 RepID=A0A1M7EB48_CHRCU|nr:nitroreductase family protein [Chryseobacterium carnipullorum]AZA47152.1 NAD(P)H-dependent oxidoreductase [Chryseobacterium carnipullorum]AZA66501.1 NAD(P)H-dependent oxidoreductase [Chryseobacterium carnipullorum]SHL88973.1 nitroreductase / dihydropteridine reductase [Chryseobacterium carnipullorum]STD08206.1 Oxygen-insensitive NAD(P)H nitroreductase [Chryseobacterium carnipullorum]HBV17926.1 NAD(P)H-dependent oxidoreductase [Chryseobacterium carnipullorum]
MNFLQQMKNRYTVKKYNPQGKISAEQIAELKEILNLSPSSINSQPWNFIFINTPDIREQLAEASYFNKDKVLESSHVIVFQVMKNPEEFEKQIEENLPEGSVNYYRTMVKPNGDAAIRSWMGHQVYLSLGVLLSACAAMGIDSTPMEGIETDKYDAILKNDSYETLFAVAIGKRADNDSNHPEVTPKRRLKSEMVILES